MTRKMQIINVIIRPTHIGSTKNGRYCPIINITKIDISDIPKTLKIKIKTHSPLWLDVPSLRLTYSITPFKDISNK